MKSILSVKDEHGKDRNVPVRDAPSGEAPGAFRYLAFGRVIIAARQRSGSQQRDTMRSPRARSTWWEIAIRQFRSAFIYLLLVAAAIVFAMGEYFDAGIILGFVIVNAALGFYQEYKSEQALRALQQFITPQVQGETGLALAYDRFPEPGAGRYHQARDRRCRAGRCPDPQHRITWSSMRRR